LIGGHVRLNMKLTEEHNSETIKELEWEYDKEKRWK
jgi:hypothetical protein